MTRRHVAASAAVATALVALVASAAAAPPAKSLSLAVGDASATEGTGGATALSFTVQLSGSPRGTVTVAYATQNGTATAPADFTAASGTLTFDKRNRVRTVAVQVVGDAVDEPNESLAVVLSNPSGAAIADGAGVGTIIDDDGAPVAGKRIAAAGDIACDPADGAFNGGQGSGLTCRQLATSNLLVGAGYDAVLPLGDDQYEDGVRSKFDASYDPSWGRVKSITKPAPGNHEYGTAGAAGYYSYFGAAAGDAAKGYYSYELGTWHVVALNSNCSAVGGCGAGSPQEEWLRADLAAHATTCTLAYWHHPRFSSGEHGSDVTYTAFWQALYDANADVVLVGHDHDYERFSPQTPSGAADGSRGLRQFVVGTGGKGLRTFPTVRPNSEVRNAAALGVLELTLGASAYDWRFRAAVGTLTDSGSGTCH